MTMLSEPGAGFWLALLGGALALYLWAAWRAGPPPDAATRRGLWGEAQLCRALARLHGYKALLPNCYLPKPDGSTAEVDLILLHESGVYVFEAKNYSGWIYGAEGRTYWLQTRPGRRGAVHRRSFYSPLLQNESHIRCLKRLLGPEVECSSYIVFGDGCTLRELELTSETHTVVYQREVRAAVARQARRTGRQLTRAQIDAYYSALLPYTQATGAQKAEHREQLAWKYQGQFSRQAMRAWGTPVCPWCGGRLRPRRGRQGRRFWGCQNYPRCTFTHEMEEE